jgi:hypothetical protein
MAAEWKDVDDTHGWQDVGSEEEGFLDKLKGVGEVAASMITGLPGFIGGGIAGATTAALTGDSQAGLAVSSELADYRYHPSSGAGKRYEENMGKGMDWVKNQIGNELAEFAKDMPRDPTAEAKLRFIGDVGTDMTANMAPLPLVPKGGRAKKAVPGKSRIDEAFEKAKGTAQAERDAKLAKDVENISAFPKETVWTDVQKSVANIHDDAILQKLREADEEATGQRVDAYVRAKEAQQAIDRRNAEQEFEVKKRTTLEMNAAERARQEAASTGYEQDLQRRLDEKFGRQANAEGERMIDQLNLDQAGPIYVDPQGQAFRGDPRETGAAEALNKQGEAMDTELTHLQGRDTPTGEPLRPLQDHVRNELIEQSKRDFPEVVREREAALRKAMAEKPINSRGKGGKQRGAVDFGGFMDEILKAFEHLRKSLPERGTDITYIDFGKGPVKAVVESVKQLEDGNVYVTAHPINPEYGQRIVASLDNFEETKDLSKTVDVYNSLPHDAYPLKQSGPREKTEHYINDQDKPVRVPRGQRGSVNMGVVQEAIEKLVSKTGIKAMIIPEDRRPPRAPDSLSNPISKETIAARDKQRQLVKRLPTKDKALDEFDVIRTPEEALELSKGAKDISPDFGQKSLGSGVNFHAAMSNSPALKFMRTVAKDVRSYADGFSRKYITDNKTGLTPLWSDLRPKERVDVMEALMGGDKHQMFVTDSVMDQLGFNDVQRQFVKTFYEADRQMFNDWNRSLNAVGLDMVDFRFGHFPGIFSGSYKTVVMDGKKVIGLATADTAIQRMLAKKAIKEKFPNATFVDQKRQSLAGTTKRYYSDIFSGMNDVLALLGKDDPKYREVQEIVQDAFRDSTNRLFNFNVHELNKKGVFGNEGNKFWKSKEENANDAFKALVQYFEEGAMHHAIQVPIKQLRDMIAAPEMAHLPNTKAYMEKYAKKMLGDDLAPLGAAFNTILDAPFQLVGVGPSIPLKSAGWVKNTMSQMFMGFGNYMFTAAQLLQPGQTGLPFMQFAASRLGLNPAHIPTSMARGGVNFMMAVMEDIAGKDLNVSPLFRDAYQYAKDRGMMTFSELEKAYQGTQSKLGRAKDEIAEFNMKVGEQLTRTPMFMSFVDLMVRGGIEPQKAFPIAENMTQFSMIDYHLWERPPLYGHLGVMGGFMSGLTTFKHGYMSQQAFLAKQAIKPPEVLTQGKDGVYAAKHKRQFAPFVLSAGLAALVFQGITGLPFYDEIDTGVKAITNAMGKQQSIREVFLKNMPEWINSGLISNASGLNMQGKFSSADMVPDSYARAASPHLEALSKIIGNAIDIAKSGGDEQSIRNFLLSVTPSGWKGATENAVAKDRDGMLIGKDSLPTLYRDPTEWRRRGLTGLRSQREAVERDKLWDYRQRDMADTAKLKELSQEYERRILNNNLTPGAQERIEREYEQRGGDPRQLYELYQKAALDKTKTEKERLEGTPRTLRGINRYENYNR